MLIYIRNNFDWRKFLLVLITGFLYTLLSCNIAPLIFVALIPYFYVIYAEKKIKMILFYSIIMGLSSLTSFSWVFTYNRNIYFLTVIVFTLIFIIFSQVSGFLLKRVKILPFFVFPIVWFLLLLIFPSMLSASSYFEYSFFFPEFPAIIRTIGARGLTFLFILFGSIIAYSIYRKSLKLFLAGLCIPLIMLISLKIPNPVFRQGDPVSIASIQGNFPETWQWRQKFVKEILHAYIELSTMAKGADIIIWPEYSIPVDIIKYRKTQREKIERLAASLKSFIILGSVDYNEKTGWHEDIALIFSPSGEQTGKYSSAHPFYFNTYTKPSKEEPQLHSFYDKKAGILICAEEFDSRWTTNYSKKGSGFLITIVNNQDTGRGMILCTKFSRIRAMESFKYLVRCSNNGITMVTDPSGKTVSIPRYKRGILTSNIYSNNCKTIYSKYGNLFLNLFSLLIILLWLTPLLTEKDGLMSRPGL